MTISPRPSQPVIVRDAELADAPALVSLLAELGFPASVDVIASRLATQPRLGPESGAHSVIVVEISQKLLGLATIHRTPVLHRPTPVGRITALVVSVPARRRGIGRALVLEAERRLAAAGCALVEITSNQRLTEAHQFYQRLGYTITSHRLCKPLETGIPARRS